ncbi:MAG: 50S ribosomal protein L10 [Planctomycetes bacterium]|nr:50S ribosomal protein L10 [Planctomycetota bacterium]
MPSRLNEYLMTELTNQFQEVRHGIFVDYTGLNAVEAHVLRGRLLKGALRMQVLKNRVAKLALQPAVGADIGVLLRGPVAVIYGSEDPVQAAKTVLECVQATGKLKVRGGFVEGMALEPGAVEQLARMPSKSDLLGQIVGGFTAPAANWAGCLDGLFRQFNFNGVAFELSGLLEAYHYQLKEKQG